MIRLAEKEDLPEILEIYANARKFMMANGNHVQWQNNHPRAEIIENDMSQKQLYVYENEGEVRGVFALVPGIDPTYIEIEGAWGSETAYRAIHRVASSGKESDVFTKMADFCKQQSGHLRIDTHELNLPMQRAVERNGFKKCGTIYIADGTPRIAYEYIEGKVS